MTNEDAIAQLNTALTANKIAQDATGRAQRVLDGSKAVSDQKAADLQQAWKVAQETITANWKDSQDDEPKT